MFLFDMEADGLLEDATRVHTVCGVDLTDMTAYSYIRPNLDLGIDWLFDQPILVGHNIFDYDLPLLERLYNKPYQGNIIDTLVIARHLHPGGRHGLEVYGRISGIGKPKIEDWKGLSDEEYRHRCQEDVKINYWLLGDFKKQYNFQVSPEIAVPYYSTWKPAPTKTELTVCDWELVLAAYSYENGLKLSMSDSSYDILSREAATRGTTIPGFGSDTGMWVHNFDQELLKKLYELSLWMNGGNSDLHGPAVKAALDSLRIPYSCCKSPECWL